MIFMMSKTYKELSRLKTFDERFEYLKLSGTVAYETFGFNRYLNQKLYNSPEWRRTRNNIILRDNGCDLGVEGYEIQNHILIHHLNPITIEDIENRAECIFDLNNLICVSHKTHNAIHYGDISQVTKTEIVRCPGDTKLW